MNYNEALAYLHSVARFGSKPGLTRINALMEHLGHPEDKLTFVHIAGTSGKGSTAAMTAAILTAAGVKTGLFVSPYVEDFRERVQIDGRPLSEIEWAEALTRIRADIMAMMRAGGPEPTEFEILAAVAIRFFYEQHCDICILEVGLGGRFDATNVIRRTAVAAVTPLSIDHAQYLGDTVAQIAFEKCGIFKPGCTVVASPDQPPEALDVIRRSADALELKLVFPDFDALTVVDATLEGSHFQYQNERYFVPLLGRHQTQNAVMAIEIAQALANRGIFVSPEACRAGLRSVRWGGRLEIVGQRPLRLIDGAHNVGKFSALARAVAELLPGRRLISVLGMSADKDVESCTALLAPLSAVLIATEYEGIRSAPADRVAQAARAFSCAVHAVPDLKEAVSLARRQTGVDDVLLVTGSLYLIGDAKRYLTV